MKEYFDSEELEELIKAHLRGEIDSVHIHMFIRGVVNKAIKSSKKNRIEKIMKIVRKIESPDSWGVKCVYSNILEKTLNKTPLTKL